MDGQQAVEREQHRRPCWCIGRKPHDGQFAIDKAESEAGVGATTKRGWEGIPRNTGEYLPHPQPHPGHRQAGVCDQIQIQSCVVKLATPPHTYTNPQISSPA